MADGKEFRGRDETDFSEVLDAHSAEEPRRIARPSIKAPAAPRESAGGESPGQRMIREAVERARNNALRPGEKPKVAPTGGPIFAKDGARLTQALRILAEAEGSEHPPKKK